MLQATERDNRREQEKGKREEEFGKMKERSRK